MTTLDGAKSYEIRELQRTLEAHGNDNYTWCVCLLALGEFDVGRGDTAGMTLAEAQRFTDRYRIDRMSHIEWNREQAITDALEAATGGEAAHEDDEQEGCGGDAILDRTVS